MLIKFYCEKTTPSLGGCFLKGPMLLNRKSEQTLTVNLRFSDQRGCLAAKLSLMTTIAFVCSADQDQTAQNVQSDLKSTLSAVVRYFSKI